MAEISVVVPVYKVEKFIHRCVDSILAQTFTDFEVILVDDGSPDYSGRICDEYAQSDKRIKVIHRANGGAAAARNTGIDAAFDSDTKWLAFVDSDDWIHPNFLEYLLSAAVENKVDIAICDCIKTQNGSEDFIDYSGSLKTAVLSSEDYWLSDEKEPPASVYVNLYKKELWKDLRFPVTTVSEDVYIVHKPIFEAGRIVKLDAVMYYYYQNPDSTTHTVFDHRRLDEWRGYLEQVSFFAENGFERAEIFAMRNVVSHLSAALSHLTNRDKDERKYYLNDRRLLRKYLKEYEDKAKISEMSDYRFFLRTAYPTEMKVKHFISKKASNLKDLFSRNK